MTLLYIWLMGHLIPRPRSRLPEYCSNRDISATYKFKPIMCKNAETWRFFLSSVKTEDIIMNTGWCSSESFLISVSGLNFIPLAGLRSVVAYFPSAVVAQFGRFQDVLWIEGSQDYHFSISVGQLNRLRAVYES